MTRLEEVEASIKFIMSLGMTGGAITPNMRDLCRTLAAEVDARDAVLDEIREIVPKGDNTKWSSWQMVTKIHAILYRKDSSAVAIVKGRTE